MTPEPEKPISNEEEQIRNFNEKKTPDILKPLWSGESIWCANCTHHVNCHQTGRVPLCIYDAAGSNLDENGNSLATGREECDCQEFVGRKEK